jgi:CDP-ribitol ribitolphosphotransferase
MGRFEYLLASGFLRLLRAAFSILPVRPRRVVLATARTPVLDGNLLHVYNEMRRAHPELEYVLLLEPYSYGLRAKLAYLVRLVRGMFFLRTARLFIVDNAYFPIHVAPPGAGTTVVQVWHAAGALKRFGLDTPTPVAEPERTFLHRNYDYVVVGGQASRQPYAAALRTPIARVLALGSPRTDFFFDAEAMAGARARLLAAHPQLDGRRVVLYAPTFRGRGEAKRAAAGFDAARLRAALPADHALVLKTHPNLDPAATPTQGYDAVIDPATEINELFTLTDILITDYSSSLFEWALLRRPLVLLTGDLADYEIDPGLYLDYRTEMIGTQVTDTDGIAAAIAAGAFDLSGYDAFIEHHLGASRGDASAAFVSHFLGGATVQVNSRSAAGATAETLGGDRLRSHVSHE